MDSALKHNDNNAAWQWFHRLGGVASMSNYYVFHIFSLIMDEPLERIIEIGTAYGGMTVGLGLEAARKEIDLWTFDVEDIVTQETGRIFKALSVNQVVQDVFSTNNFVQGLIDLGPCYLLCDGGDKVKELKTFAPLLKSGSIVSVHDWGTEIAEKDTEFMNEIATPFHPELWAAHNVQLATWKIN